MNSESSSSNQDNPSNLAPIKELNERKIWDMEQDMELLQEHVKSLKQELADAYEYTNKCLQELEFAKQELEWMNQEISNLINSKKLPMDEAKLLASRMLKAKRFVGSRIYKFKAEFSNIRAESHQMIAHSIQLRAESKQITVQSYKIQARAREIREHSYEVRVQLCKKRVFQELLKCKIGSRLP
ncbi:hypothetical protein H6F96_02975 [Microcoleus sp. FACHB-53]|nr:hypothetical protein [Microcoleus sp. FACHB-53]